MLPIPWVSGPEDIRGRGCRRRRAESRKIPWGVEALCQSERRQQPSRGGISSCQLRQTSNVRPLYEGEVWNPWRGNVRASRTTAAQIEARDAIRTAKARKHAAADPGAIRYSSTRKRSPTPAAAASSG